MLIKRIKFYLRCIKITWDAREEKNCRQKWRRLARAYQKLSREMGLG